MLLVCKVFFIFERWSRKSVFRKIEKVGDVLGSSLTVNVVQLKFLLGGYVEL